MTKKVKTTGDVYLDIINNAKDDDTSMEVNISLREKLQIKPLAATLLICYALFKNHHEIIIPPRALLNHHIAKGRIRDRQSAWEQMNVLRMFGFADQTGSGRNSKWMLKNTDELFAEELLDTAVKTLGLEKKKTKGEKG